MHETENILYLVMSVYSVKQKNLVSFSSNILVSHLSCPLPALIPPKTLNFQLIILFSLFLQSKVKRQFWIKSVVYSRIFFSWKSHQDTEFSFLCEILLLSLVAILVLACVYCCTNKWLRQWVSCAKRGDPLVRGVGRAHCQQQDTSPQL